MTDETEGFTAYDRRAQVEALWQVDDTWTGDVFRQIQRGMSPKQIADEGNITISCE